MATSPATACRPNFDAASSLSRARARQGKLCRCPASKRDGRCTTTRGLPGLWLQLFQNAPLQDMSYDPLELILVEIGDGPLPTIICSDCEERLPQGATALNQAVPVGYTAEAGKLFDEKVLWRHRINPRKRTPLHITSPASDTLRQSERCRRTRDGLILNIAS